MDIESFNDRLVLNESNYDIITYIKYINEMSKNPIDLSFMSELMDYVGKSECIVPHTLLKTYGAFDSDIVSILNIQYMFKENSDYLVVDNGSSGNVFYLKPKAFKKCLLKSKNRDKYIDYYMLIERAMVYYYRYQLKIRDKEIKDLLTRVCHS